MLASPAKTMIYVVDDDLDVLGSLQFLLETDGFDVRTFKSGAALLGDAASDDADCFVIDYKMPQHERPRPGQAPEKPGYFGARSS